MFDDDDARRGAGEPARVRRRASPAAAPASTSRSACCPRCCATSSRSRATCRTRDTGLKTFFNELGDAARIVAPAAETQADLFVNLDTTFTALNAVARPVHPGLDHRGRPALDAAISRSRSSGRSCATPRACSASCARASRALRTAAPDLADALDRRHAAR